MDTSAFALDNEQWCLRNTYLNSLCLEPEEEAVQDKRKKLSRSPKRNSPRITFAGPHSAQSGSTARTREGSILAIKPATLHHPLIRYENNYISSRFFEVEIATCRITNVTKVAKHREA